jgi:hypothetical protein
LAGRDTVSISRLAENLSLLAQSALAQSAWHALAFSPRVKNYRADAAWHDGTRRRSEID